jgi:hypothetical protein
MAGRNRLSGRAYMIIITVLILLLWYAISTNPIVCYPARAHYYSYMLAVGLIILTDSWSVIRALSAMQGWRAYISHISVTVLKWTLLTFIIATIILIPFNYYERHIAQDSAPQTLICGLDEFVSRYGHQEIAYTCDGRENILYCTGLSIEDSLATQPVQYLKSHQLIITARRALMGSYVIDEFHIAGRSPQ